MKNAIAPLKRIAAAVLGMGRRTHGKPHGPHGVVSMGHREYVGGLWEEIGRLQFDFAVKNGLRPEHYLLDIACGSLRAGVHFIPYLQPGHYLGIEKEALLIEAGKRQELTPALLAEKRPQFVVSNSFEFDQFTARPDFAIAQSLFTHFPPELIELCFRKLRSAMKDDGVFFATYFEGSAGSANPATAHDHDCFYYSRDEMIAFGEHNGWTSEYIGDWGHPRRQVMVRYRPRLDTPRA